MIRHFRRVGVGVAVGQPNGYMTYCPEDHVLHLDDDLPDEAAIASDIGERAKSPVSGWIEVDDDGTLIAGDSGADDDQAPFDVASEPEPEADAETVTKTFGRALGGTGRQPEDEPVTLSPDSGTRSDVSTPSINKQSEEPA